jgi:hypothetical protein
VTPGRLIERRDAHQSVHAGFRRKQTVGVVTRDRDRDALEPGLLSGLVVDDLGPEAAPLRPAEIHSQQHLGPVLRLGPAGAGMNGHERVLAIVLAPQHLLDLARLHFLVECVERPRDVGFNGFAGGGPLEQHRQVVGLASQRHHEVAVLLETSSTLQNFLRFSLVFPEIGRGGARLEAGQFFVRASTFKDNSGALRHAG